MIEPAISRGCEELAFLNNSTVYRDKKTASLNSACRKPKLQDATREGEVSKHREVAKS